MEGIGELLRLIRPMQCTAPSGKMYDGGFCVRCLKTPGEGGAGAEGVGDLHVPALSPYHPLPHPFRPSWVGVHAGG